MQLRSHWGSDGKSNEAVTSGLASIAESQLGCGPCGGTGDNGQTCSTYGDSCNEAWCADFVSWVWSQAGFKTNGLSACSGSFYNYGQANGTLHYSNPQVGDAIVWNYGDECGGRHVEIVVDVSNAGSGHIKAISGNGCDNDVCVDYPCASAGDWVE